MLKRPASPIVRDEEAAGSNPATPTRVLPVQNPVGRYSAGLSSLLIAGLREHRVKGLATKWLVAVAFLPREVGADLRRKHRQVAT
jgi:hypothetical protein